MKSPILLLILSIAILASSCNSKGKGENQLLPADVVENPASAQQGADSKANTPKIFFDKMEHDFGRLVEGERVEYSFNFKNTGEADLLIDACYGSCGCTVPEWPKQPIKPGENGKIKVSFDSKGRTGHNDKTITILANTTPRSTIIRIKAQVTK